MDSLRLIVKGGAGGMGMPKYGGIGGKGGDVYVEADQKADLLKAKRIYSSRVVTAHKGEDSRKVKIYGEPGLDKVIPVPVGVTIYDAYQRKLGDLNAEKEKLLVAQGGYGGSATSHPAFLGGKGEEQTITLDLKLIADVGLVGFPNAGKSTLLKAISKANPQIAAYAFTTLRPNLGIVHYPDLRQIQVADLPGLIEGASYNLGMGHKFLKHVERTKIILMVVDVNGFQLNPAQKYRNGVETVILLNKELELYKEELIDKPAMLVVNKMDLPGATEKFNEMKPYLENLESLVNEIPEKYKPNKLLKFRHILPISAKTDPKSAASVKEIIREALDEIGEETEEFLEIKNESEALEEIRKKNVEFDARML